MQVTLASNFEQFRSDGKVSKDAYYLIVMEKGDKVSKGGKQYTSINGKICEIKETKKGIYADDTNPISYEKFCSLEESEEEKETNYEARKLDFENYYLAKNRNETKEEMVEHLERVAFIDLKRKFHMIARTEGELKAWDEEKEKEKNAILNLLEMKGRISSVFGGW